jgi:hypothetical protein
MPVYKITMAFTLQSQGWTETLYLSTANPFSLANVRDLYAIPLVKLRLNLAVGGVTNTYLRIGQYGVPFAVQTFEGQGAGTFDGSADVPNVALLMRGSPVIAGPTKAWYMHGIPDSVIINGSYGPSYAFQAAVQSLRNYLESANQTGAYGWIGVTQTAKVKCAVSGYTINEGFQVVISFLPTPAQTQIFTGVPINTKVRLRLSGVNGKSELNGVQVCLVTANNQATTVGQFGVLSYKYGGFGVYEPTNFITLAGINDEKVVTRKTGKPLFLARGRALARART